ncbi:hypothetical protein U9M48_003438 [Paspalum notatum var. saurae]|uniref:Reverse transcriptase domain-containing protein n=1 Tax=Paspalum notatum var. saurae TaxID=547442 RepID=A0AAQ3PTD4_PASNO
MNEVLRGFIGKFVVVYFDDILIYSKSLHEHMDHLRAVFAALRAARLFVSLRPQRFHKCEASKHLLDFIVALCQISAPSLPPSNELTKRGGKSQKDAFNLLKDKLTHAPLLQLPDFGKTFELECDDWLCFNARK